MIAPSWFAASLVLLNLHAIPFAEVPPGGEPAEPTAIAIVEGKLAYVGTDAKRARAVGGSGAQIMDLAGRTVLPGFNDAHVHLGMQVTLGSRASIEIGEVDRATFVQRLQRAAQQIAGDWLFVRARSLPPDLVPDDLDKIGKAILIASAHGGRINKKAQALGGFAEHECEGGMIRGRLLAAALERIAQHLPDAYLVAEAKELLAGLARSGITSVQLIDDLPSLFSGLLARGELTARVRMIPFGYRFDTHYYRPKFDSPNPSFLRINGAKYFHDDGARIPRGELRELFRLTAQDRQQLVVHVLSAHAVDSFLDQLEPAAKLQPGLGKLVRFEHVDEITPHAAARLAALGVIVCQNPAMLPEWSRKDAFPLRTLHKAGVTLCIGSDWVGDHTPARPYDPFFAIGQAVNRNEEALPLYDVLRAFTVGSAEAEGMAHEKGAIVEGLLADLVVLSEDPFRLPDSELSRVRAVMTIVGGQIVYRAPGVGERPSTISNPQPPTIGPPSRPEPATIKKQK